MLFLLFDGNMRKLENIEKNARAVNKLKYYSKWMKNDHLQSETSRERKQQKRKWKNEIFIILTRQEWELASEWANDDTWIFYWWTNGVLLFCIIASLLQEQRKKNRWNPFLSNDTRNFNKALLDCIFLLLFFSSSALLSLSLLIVGCICAK